MDSLSVSKYNFTAELNGALQCVICLDVAEDPRQHEKCGRLFCKECLEKYGDKPCPNCRREHPKYFEDNRSRREIKALGVKCSNKMRGCEWVGTVGTLEEHVATCGFTLVPCPKQCKRYNCSPVTNHCEEVTLCLMRRDVHKHLINDCPNRDYECQSNCGEKGTYAYVTGAHDKVCKMKILICPNPGCDGKVQRQHVIDHIGKCPHTVISCKYKIIGCDVELKRGDITAHEHDDKLHLHMALDTVTLQQAINRLQHTAGSQENEIARQRSVINNLELRQQDKIASAIGELQVTTEVQQTDITLQQADIRKLQQTTNSQQDIIDSLQAKVSCGRILILCSQITEEKDKLQGCSNSHPSTPMAVDITWHLECMLMDTTLVRVHMCQSI